MIDGGGALNGAAALRVRRGIGQDAVTRIEVTDRAAMQRVWAPLFPGFRWLSAGTFSLGLAEGVFYGALLGGFVVEARRMVARVIG